MFGFLLASNIHYPFKALKIATRKDKAQVVDILISAFEPYVAGNSINLVVKQDKHRLQRMRVLMSYLFEKAMLFGSVFLSDNGKACVLVNHSSENKTTLKTIWLDIQLAFKCIGIRRVFKVLKRQKIAKRNYPKENHIKPMILGVMQTHKGKGTAARLMLQVKHHYRDNELPVMLDTVSEYNVGLYQKFGFQVIAKDESLGFPIYFLRLNRNSKNVSV